MQSDKIIEVHNLVKAFGSFRAVDNISFDVKKGEIFGFLGANGAGKTTAMKMLTGLLRPTSGEASVAGDDVHRETEKIKRTIGYMSQRFSLYGDLTVKENIRLYGGIYGLRSSRIKEKTTWMLDRLDMRSSADSLIDSLPPGWKQKLAFSVAMLHDPKIIFLDEPTGGVDPVTRRQFWEMIYEAAARDTTIFVTTHYMDEAEYCDRISMMVSGRIAALGSPDELKEGFNAKNMDEVFVGIARGRKNTKRMKRFRSFVQKEFYHILRDKRTLLILFGIPIAQILLFGYAITNEIREAKIAILDHSKDAQTELIKDRILASSYFDISGDLSHELELENAFRDGKTKLVVIFEDHFAEKLEREGTASIQLIADAADPNTANTLVSYLEAIIAEHTSQLNPNKNLPFRIKMESRMWYNPELKGVYYFVPGLIAILLMLVSAMMTSISIAREKELGTMEVLLASPMTPGQIILAKVLPLCPSFASRCIDHPRYGQIRFRSTGRG